MKTFHLPDLGEGLAEAEIVAWHVAVGQRVRSDEPMVSVETAKAVVELPVPFAGVVAALHADAGEIVATGAPLIDLIGDATTGDATPTPTATAIGIATETGSVVGQLPAGDGQLLEQVPEPRDRSPSSRPARTRALPVARAAAKRLGVDLSGIAGSGRDGVVTLDDVLGRVQPRPAAPPAVAARAAEFGGVATPLRGARRAMAHTMAQARDSVVLSTVCDDADIEAWPARGGYLPRLLRAIAVACRAEPALNAWYDAVDNSRVLRATIDLGVAIDTPDGLIVPVLRDIANRTPAELAAALAAHKAAAREHRTSAADLRDATISLSNFGTLAGRYAVPQVVPPAVAILGAGKVRREAVVAGDAVVAHWRMPLSLSFDHRCVTGGEACRFLAAVIADLEKSA